MSRHQRKRQREQVQFADGLIDSRRLGPLVPFTGATGSGKADVLRILSEELPRDRDSAPIEPPTQKGGQ